MKRKKYSLLFIEKDGSRVDMIREKMHAYCLDNVKVDDKDSYVEICGYAGYMTTIINAKIAIGKFLYDR